MSRSSASLALIAARTSDNLSSIRRIASTLAASPTKAFAAAVYWSSKTPLSNDFAGRRTPETPNRPSAIDLLRPTETPAAPSATQSGWRDSSSLEQGRRLPRVIKHVAALRSRTPMLAEGRKR